MKSPAKSMRLQARRLAMMSLMVALTCAQIALPKESSKHTPALPKQAQVQPGPFSASFARACKLRAEGDYRASIAACQSAMPAARAKDRLVYLNLCCIAASDYLALKNESQWRKIVDGYLAEYPRDTRMLFVKARHLLASESPAVVAEGKRCLDLIRREKLTPAQVAQILDLEGTLAYRQRRFKDYVILSKRAYDLDPNLATCYIHASACSVAGDNRASAQYFLKCAEIDKTRADLAVAAVGQLQAAGDLPAATQLAYDICKKNPESVLGPLAVADCLLKTKMSANEKRQLRKKLEALEDSKCTKLQQGQKYRSLLSLVYGLGDVPAELKYANKAAAADPSPESMGCIAAACFDDKQFARAASWYRKLLAITPRDTYSMERLAICEARLDHLSLAIQLCTQALSIDPRSVNALKTRGAIYCVLGQTEKAVADAEQLQKLHPEKGYSLETLRGLGLPYIKDLRQYMQDATTGWQVVDEQKIAKLTREIAAEPKSDKRASLLQARARVKFAMGQYAEALGDLNQSIQMGNNSYRVHSLKAGALFGLKKWPEAKAERALTVALHDSQRPPSVTRGRQQTPPRRAGGVQ